VRRTATSACLFSATLEPRRTRMYNRLLHAALGPSAISKSPERFNAARTRLDCAQEVATSGFERLGHV
jgi:hypothetical protein